MTMPEDTPQEKRYVKRWVRRKLLLMIVALLAIALIVLVFLPHLIPDHSVKVFLESQLTKDLARQVKIGAVEWVRWGYIKLHNIDIHARKGFGRQSLITIEQLEINHGILPLLWGKLVVHNMEINSLAISIQKDKSGKLCIDDLIRDTLPPVSVERLALSNGSCEFTDKTLNKTFSARKIHLILNRQNAHDPILYRLGFEFIDTGKPAKVEMTGEMQFPFKGLSDLFNQENRTRQPQLSKPFFNGNISFSGLDIHQKFPEANLTQAGNRLKQIRLLNFRLEDSSGEATIETTMSQRGQSPYLKTKISTDVQFANIIVNLHRSVSSQTENVAQQDQLAVLALGSTSLSSKLECRLSPPDTTEQKGINLRFVEIKSLSLESEIGNLTASGNLDFENEPPNPSVTLNQSKDFAADLNANLTLNMQKALALLSPLLPSIPEQLELSGKTQIERLSIKGHPSDLLLSGCLDMTGNAARYISSSDGSIANASRGNSQLAPSTKQGDATSATRQWIKKVKEPATVDFTIALKPNCVELKEAKFKSVPLNGKISAKFEQMKDGPSVKIKEMDIKVKSESFISSLPRGFFALPEELKISGWTEFKASGEIRPNDLHASVSISADLTNNAISYIPAHQLRALRMVSRSAKSPKAEAAYLKNLSPIIIKRKNDSDKLNLKIVVHRPSESAKAGQPIGDDNRVRCILEIEKFAWKSYLGTVNLSGGISLPLENSDFDLRTEAEFDIKRLRKFILNRRLKDENRKSSDWNISGKPRLTFNVKGTTDAKAQPKTLSANGTLDLTNSALIYTGTAIKPASEEVNIDFAAELNEGNWRLKQLALVSPTDSIVFSGEMNCQDALTPLTSMNNPKSFTFTMRSNIDTGKLLKRVPEILLMRHQIPTIPKDLKIAGQTQCVVSSKGTPHAFDFNCSIDMSRNSLVYSNLFNKQLPPQRAAQENTMRFSLKGKWRAESSKLNSRLRKTTNEDNHKETNPPSNAKISSRSRRHGVEPLSGLTLTDLRLELGDAIFTVNGKMQVGSSSALRDFVPANLNLTGKAPQINSLTQMLPFLKDYKIEGGLAFNVNAKAKAGGRRARSLLDAYRVSGDATFDNVSVTCDSKSASSSKIGVDGKIDFTTTSFNADKLKLSVNDNVVTASVNLQKVPLNANSPTTSSDRQKFAKLAASLESKEIDVGSIAHAVNRIHERWEDVMKCLRKNIKATRPSDSATRTLSSKSPKGKETNSLTPRWLTIARALSFSGYVKMGEILIGHTGSDIDRKTEGNVHTKEDQNSEAFARQKKRKSSSRVAVSDAVDVIETDLDRRHDRYEGIYHIKDLRVPISLEGGTLKINALSFVLNEGRVTADIEARLSSESTGLTYDLHTKAVGVRVADNVRPLLKSIFPNLKGGDKFDFESHGKGNIIVKDDLFQTLEASLDTQRGESVLDVTGGYMEGQGATDLMIKLFPALRETRYPLKSTHIELQFSPERAYSKMYFDGQNIDMCMEGTMNNITKEIDYWMSVDLIANLGLSSVRDNIPNALRKASKIDIMHYTGKVDDQHVDFIEPKVSEVASTLKNLFLVKDAIALFNPSMSYKEKTKFFQGRMQSLFGPERVLKEKTPRLFKIYKKVGSLIRTPFNLFKWERTTKEQVNSQS